MQLRPRFSRLGMETIVRSTNDLDCFLGADVISDSSKTRRIAEVLQVLGFASIQDHWQFSKTLDSRGELHIDLLAADVPASLRDKIQRPNDQRRLRPKGFDRLHGRRTPEAVTIHQHTTRMDASTNGREAYVLVPHPMSFILMKLFAFRDRLGDSSNEYGAYHAFDALQIVDSLDQTEWSEAQMLLADPSAAAIVGTAQSIVATHFESARSDGSIRLFDYARSRQGIPLTVAQLEHFVEELRDLFATC
jgi:hypothetical protein